MLLRTLSFYMILFSFFVLSSNYIHAADSVSITNMSCEESKEEYTRQFNSLVIEDVKKSFEENLTPLITGRPTEYDSSDIHKAKLAVGIKNRFLDSLGELLSGVSLGERKLYIVGGQPQTMKYQNRFIGFLLYKKLNGKNVLVKIRRGEKQWEVVEITEKTGKHIKWNPPNCDK